MISEKKWTGSLVEPILIRYGFRTLRVKCERIRLGLSIPKWNKLQSVANKLAMVNKLEMVNKLAMTNKTAMVNNTAVKKKWYHEGLRFECTQCGNCCSGDPGYVWATKEEIKKIAQFLDEDEHWLGKKHLRRVGFRYSLTEKKDGDCIFLKREDGKSMCAIYPVRPLQCRTWPFWSPNLASGKAWDRIGENCPGLDHGKKHTYVQIEQRRTQKSWSSTG